MARKPKPKEFFNEFVEIEWHDANSKSAWHYMDEANALDIALVRSRGWIVQDNERCITLAASIIEGDDKACGDIISIPRGCVISITEI